MRNKKYFKTEDSELCYPLEYHLLEAKDQGLDEIELFEAVTEKIDGFFWCNKYLSVGEKGNCGKICAEYDPRNGKSGICKHNSIFHEPNLKVKFKVK